MDIYTPCHVPQAHKIYTYIYLNIVILFDNNNKKITPLILLKSTHTHMYRYIKKYLSHNFFSSSLTLLKVTGRVIFISISFVAVSVLHCSRVAGFHFFKRFFCVFYILICFILIQYSFRLLLLVLFLLIFNNFFLILILLNRKKKNIKNFNWSAVARWFTIIKVVIIVTEGFQLLFYLILLAGFDLGFELFWNYFVWDDNVCMRVWLFDFYVSFFSFDDFFSILWLEMNHILIITIRSFYIFEHYLIVKYVWEVCFEIN